MNGRKLYRKGPDRWSQKRDSRIKNGIELKGGGAKESKEKEKGARKMVRGHRL